MIKKKETWTNEENKLASMLAWMCCHADEDCPSEYRTEHFSSHLDHSDFSFPSLPSLTPPYKHKVIVLGTTAVRRILLISFAEACSFERLRLNAH